MLIKEIQGSEISCVPANPSAGKPLPGPHRNNHPGSGGDDDDEVTVMMMMIMTISFCEIVPSCLTQYVVNILMLMITNVR